MVGKQKHKSPLKYPFLRHRRLWAATAVVLVLGSAAYALWGGSDDRLEGYTPGAAVAKRLSGAQYRAIIADAFGPDIRLGGRFEKEIRIDGLLAVGASHMSISPAGMEQYDNMATRIAAQVTDANRRDLLIPCQPASVAKPDAACARQFLKRAGLLLFRRPLSEHEVHVYVEAAGVAAEELGSFFEGLAMALAAMLESPQFLFRQESIEPDPDRVGRYRLDSYSKAARLSFFLWNTAPDIELLDAAANGVLHTRRGLTSQVDRMLASPRLEAGVRAFFTDMFGFDDFSTLTKDAKIYPFFGTKVKRDAQEQTLRTIDDLLVGERADYREIFTTRKTYLTQALARVYGVPLPQSGYNGTPDIWQPFEFAAEDPRAGILSHVSFVALHSPPGRSSVTLRGKALREVMLCQEVPAPPAGVMFELVNDLDNPKYRTARDRLQAHNAVPSCAGCHKIMDPLGYAFENFDGSGAYRSHENGALIDASGELDGVPFEDLAGLGKAVAGNPAAVSCLVDRVTAYGLGRTPIDGERPWVAQLKEHFAENGYVLPELMRRIATSEEFYRAAAPQAATTTASVTAPSAGEAL